MWFAMSLEDDGEAKCSKCFWLGNLMYFYPLRTGNDASLGSIRRNQGLKAEPDIVASFYFDAALKSLKGVSDWKESNESMPLTYTKCSDFVGPDPLIQEGANVLGYIKKVAQTILIERHQNILLFYIAGKDQCEIWKNYSVRKWRKFNGL